MWKVGGIELKTSILYIWVEIYTYKHTSKCLIHAWVFASSNTQWCQGSLSDLYFRPNTFLNSIPPIQTKTTCYVFWSRIGFYWLKWQWKKKSIYKVGKGSDRICIDISGNFFYELLWFDISEKLLDTTWFWKMECQWKFY